MKYDVLPSGSYRYRKVLNGKRLTIVLPYAADDSELMVLFAQKLKEENIPSKGSFEYCAKEYIQDRENVLSPSSIRTYNIHLKRMTNEFKDLDIGSITQEEVSREINKAYINLSAKTVKSLHGFIASVLGAYRPEMTLHTKLPAEKKKDDFEPKTDDIKKILEEVKETRYSIPFQLGVLGLRRGEICSLTMDDLKENKLTIHRNYVYDSNNKWIVKETPKTEASNRTIILPDRLVKEINDAGCIYDGHPNALNKAIHRVQKRLGIHEFKFHQLRSYFASYCHAQNVPDVDIMAMGGWASDSIMKSVYRKAMQESKEKSMKKISDKILG